MYRLEKLRDHAVSTGNRVEGNWKVVKGKVKEQWGRLTEDDLEIINGRRDQLAGKIQQRYGIARDEAQKAVKDWFDSFTRPETLDLNASIALIRTPTTIYQR